MDVDDLIGEAEALIVQSSDSEFVNAGRDLMGRMANALEASNKLIASQAEEILLRSRRPNGCVVPVCPSESKTKLAAEAMGWAEWFAAERDLYREGIDWNTSCLGCARTLGACYEAERERDEAKAAIEKVQAWANYQSDAGANLKAGVYRDVMQGYDSGWNAAMGFVSRALKGEQ